MSKVLEYPYKITQLCRIADMNKTKTNRVIDAINSGHPANVTKKELETILKIHLTKSQSFTLELLTLIDKAK